MEKVLSINHNYTVFSDGRIFSKISGKFLKPWKTNKGYPIVSLFDGKGGHKFYLLHRLIATAFIPNPENKPCVDHWDCNRENCSVENLRWVTYSENNRNPITVKKLDMEIRCADVSGKTIRYRNVFCVIREMAIWLNVMAAYTKQAGKPE